MSDREIMDAKFGHFRRDKSLVTNESIINPELYHKIRNTKDIKLDTQIKDFRHMPNQKWHKIVSFIKSGVRIFGYLLIPFSLPLAAGVLVFSEIIGIIEELV